MKEAEGTALVCGPKADEEAALAGFAAVAATGEIVGTTLAGIAALAV